MESQFYHINLLQLLLKWKVHLAVIVIIALALSAIFSGPSFITPKYKSFAIVYPSNIAPYSDENETEQMLQILQSKDISDQVIERFNLIDHYGIDRNDPEFFSWLMWEYSQNVKIAKTPNEAVEIEVLDANPQIASDMVNAIIEFYNNKVKTLHEEKFGEVVKMYSRALVKKQASIDSLKMELAHLGKDYGLLDYEAQSEEVTKGYLKTVEGSAGQVRDREVNELKKNMEDKGGEVLLLLNLIENEANTYADLKYEYEKAYMDFDRQFSYTNILNKPYPADKKAYPVRWLIVVISTLAAFFVSFIVILILENYKGMSKSKK
ncbi:MAG: hypothetical protein KDC09_00755 [Bacteroidales bacterium]|nr:hypothetical protein [Bacteroidales bacterium]